MYIIGPNTRVRWKAAVAGAVVAVLFIEIFQIVFLSWVKTSVAYNVVYGKAAAFPIFLAWIYFNWVAVLLGAETGYLVQNVPTLLRESREPGHLAWDERERLALASASLLATHGELEPERLSGLLRVSPRILHPPLDDLQDAGWLEPVCDANGQLCAYRALPRLPRATLAEVVRSLRALGQESSDGSRQRALPVPPAWMAVLEPLERDADRPYESISVAELARKLPVGEAAEPSPPTQEERCRDSSPSARSASA
jgi:membrane protein